MVVKAIISQVEFELLVGRFVLDHRRVSAVLVLVIIVEFTKRRRDIILFSDSIFCSFKKMHMKILAIRNRPFVLLFQAIYVTIFCLLDAGKLFF